MHHDHDAILAALRARGRAPAFSPASDRAAWTALAGVPRHRRMVEGVVAQAEANLGQPWSTLLASGYLAFSRSGDRVGYETPYFARRDRLGLAAVAYALTADERFLRDAADGIWLICDEATWCLPSHLGQALPPPEGDVPDLFNCQTAHVLAEACALLAGPLERWSPAVPRRARAEVRRRIIGPVLAGGHWWWMEGHNNWGPWCASSVAAAACWSEDEPDRLARVLDGMLAVGRRFYDRYPEDGGCDEGVGYWTVAAGALVMLLETVQHATGLPMYGAEKLMRMVRFPAAMRLGDGWFPAFADAGARGGLPLGLCWRAGERTGCRELQALVGPEIAAGPAPKVAGTGSRILALLRWFFWTGDGAIPALPVEGDDWLPDLQVLVTRGGGTALAVKGGHNAENHNHNDVGQFVVHRRDRPVLVDAGCDTYTRQVFSPRRYELWWTRSAGHAVPIVGGHEQQPGQQYAARGVGCERDAARAAFTADLAGCYAAEAGVLGLRRTVELERATGIVTLADQLRQRTAQAAELPLLAPARPQPDGAGLRLEGMRLELEGIAVAAVEQVDLPADSLLARKWPDGLWRIRLAAPAATELSWRLRLVPV